MFDRASIEKRLTVQMIESGELTLGVTEHEALGLTPHSQEVQVAVAGGDGFFAQWSGRGRRLGGEPLQEALQLHARVGDLVRLCRIGEGLELVIAPAPRALTVPNRVWESLPSRAPTIPGPSARIRKRARISGERFRLRDRSEYAWTGQVGIHIDTSRTFAHQIGTGGWDPADMVHLRLEGERLATLDNFEELLATASAHIDPLSYQEATAREALSRLRGRVILADEVGLGKTIEAGLILKELLLRGLARRILVITPATLRDQWRVELLEKFEEEFTIATTSGQDMKAERLIMSLELAVRNAERVAATPWDLVVVDEAHKLAGPQAKARRGLIAGLTPRYLLFLSATPVQNDLLELYRLVDLLKPGTFRSAADFKRRYVSTSDPRQPVKPAELRRLVSDVMIRTTREQAGLDRVTRYANDRPITLSSPELTLYRFCTETLRSVMTDPGDALRRRQLAHRLTASPASMGATALRMAESHPDPRVRETLRELGHVAAEVKGSAREKIAVEQIRAWLDAHGRVLVFSQHTDTVEAILRRLAEEGIDAHPFHGSMSAGAKGDAIAWFKAASGRVLVSTDAGAEGLNLQFCNTVLNFDLPWNPMRIEQRIGRVHRVTQTRDVHIANLFALGTVDESVYSLLHDKLRMFELLFGQVTTILGELDQTDGARTFEGRVMDAFLAPSDKDMTRRLGALGKQLEDARRRADEMVSAGSHINRWASPELRHAHRAGIPKGGAEELRPKVREREATRQGQLRQFVEKFLATFDAEVTHASPNLLSARLPEDLVADFGGRSEVHLAFNRAGVGDHPDAELCAVGSEVFEEMLVALRLRGDLTAVQAQPPDLSALAPTTHSETIRLLSRTVQRTWAAKAHWKVGTGDLSTGESIDLMPAGDSTSAGLARVALEPGSPLPPDLPLPADLVRALEEVAVARLEQRVKDEQALVLNQTLIDRDRMEEYFEAQLEEPQSEIRKVSIGTARWGELKNRINQIDRARSAYREAVAPQVEIRAELTAVELVAGANFKIVEQWEKVTSGARAETSYAWTSQNDAARYQADDGSPVAVLDLCSSGHFVDASRNRRCPSCDTDFCAVCATATQFAACRLCGMEVCGVCLDVGDGFCHSCFDPSRLPTADSEWLVGWQLGGGRSLLVGDRVAELRSSTGETVRVVPGAAMSDPLRVRVRAFASGLGLPENTGIKVIGGFPEPKVSPMAISYGITREATQAVMPHGGPTIDPESTAFLPGAEARDDVVAEEAIGIAALLERLRAKVEPPAAPCIRITPSLSIDEISVSPQGLVWRRGKILRATEHIETSTVVWTAQRPSWALEGWNPEPLFLRHAEIDGTEVVVAAIGTAVLLGVRDNGETRWHTIQDNPGDVGGLALGRAFLRQDVVLKVGTMSSPGLIVGPTVSGAKVQSRSTAPDLVEAGPGGELPVATVLDAWLPGTAFQLPAALPAWPDLRPCVQAIVEREAPALPERRVNIGARVTERWISDHGGEKFEVSYACPPGQTKGFITDSVTGMPTSSVYRDRSGHLVASVVACSYCGTLTCPNCPAEALPCLGCGVPVCEYCSVAVFGGSLRCCPACSGPRPATRSDTIRVGRELERKHAPLMASDAFHYLVWTSSPDKSVWVCREQLRSDGRSRDFSVWAQSPMGAWLSQHRQELGPIAWRRGAIDRGAPVSPTPTLAAGNSTPVTHS